MRRNKYIIIVILAILGLNSCSDDFIEVENKEVLTDSSFWQTEDHALQALTSTYAALHSSSGSKWAFFEEIYTAMAYKADDMINNTAETYSRALASFTNTTEESGPFNIWRSAYAGIGRANQILERVPEMEALSQETKDVIVAEAKFLRAYYYFWLVTGFENVPLVTTYETSPESLFPSQASTAEVWAQIETDLMEAEANLVTEHAAEWRGRATVGSASALLGKAYLFQEKWTEAEAKFAQVVAMDYDLLENYEDNFNGRGENGAESVFEIQFTGDRSNGNDERQVFNFEVSPYAFGGWELFYPSQWLVDEMRTDLNTDGDPSDRVYASIFFDDPGSEMYSRDIDDNVAYTDAAGDLNHPKYFKKYSFNEDTNFYNGTNIAVIRFADVLLMYAEALNENGKTTEAIAEVNKVRERGGAVPLAAMSQSDLRTQIRHHERPVELSMEFGIRWFDLYRWQRGSTATESIGTTLENHGKPFAENFQDKHILYPIPLQEININENLDQNPGW
ncbi:RagB/SusD family nutrient uptake outer membrane protein [Muricauda sp. 2012CJ35-5]|uniref:RagB/SusD family nutrient uptake outer membrane protein n=1 Tax=Flagellimonas spongiicola TaxID=2942208 RepID=A0ABT0PQW7_9FLAO|nr:RagB/SusD family nutrient uptake outer membrane protein [Allomuricauda spongiicola]MCL6273779.1 RagB/SusD family nutrient uptake outer membrane protein [Allomuricauda spongiicola]